MHIVYDNNCHFTFSFIFHSFFLFHFPPRFASISLILPRFFPELSFGTTMLYEKTMQKKLCTVWACLELKGITEKKEGEKRGCARSYGRACQCHRSPPSACRTAVRPRPGILQDMNKNSIFRLFRHLFAKKSDDQC